MYNFFYRNSSRREVFPFRQILSIKDFDSNRIYRYPQKFSVLRYIFSFILILLCATLSAQHITLNQKGIKVSAVLWQIKKQTGLDAFVATSSFDTNRVVDADFVKSPVNEVLDKILKGTHFTYSIIDKSIRIFERPKERTGNISSISQQDIVRGRVIDVSGNALVGVVVKIENGKEIGTTTKGGEFSVVADAHEVLLFSFLGTETKRVSVADAKNNTIKLQPTSKEMEEVVVNTGIYQRSAESFTGSSATFTEKELKEIGNTNVLQSLRTLDPSFAIRENNVFGSNPNRLANVEVRGKTSIIGLTQEFDTDPNQPLFILDGFESTLQMISDLSMERVANITILKDAAATAIYGSKAANGVIVVETKKPIPGKLRLSYNGNYSVDFADLSDYNLMNSFEKLEFEKLSLLYASLDANGNIINEANAEVYKNRLIEANRGVNTDWANEPLRFGGTSRHTIFAEGGDESMRYGAGFSYGKTDGVMKGSDRNVMNGNIRLIYRKNKFIFSEYLNVDYVKSNEEAVPFSKFVRTNPYYRMYDEEGNLNRILEVYTVNAVGRGQNEYVFNPVYDRLRNNMNTTDRLSIRNNLEVEWSVLQELRARARVSLTKGLGNTEVFKSPYMSEFLLVDNIRKGSYANTTQQALDYDTDFSITYGKLLSKVHMLNAVAGFRASNNQFSTNTYRAEGFADDINRTPAFATQYAISSPKPAYAESIKRSLSYYGNLGYAYDNRYLMDATFRLDGASVFGSNNRLTNTWSVGLSWNIHKEHFFDADWISQLRVRGSVGNPGNQNFDAYIAYKTYAYNNQQTNPFGLSALTAAFGNPDLQWQKTLDKNIGFDTEFFNRRLRINADYFVKETDPLLVYATVPSSTGTTSLATNLGAQRTVGFTSNIMGVLVQNGPWFWSVNANVRTLRSRFYNIGNSLENLNLQNRGISTNRYYDGGSPTSIWTVRSAGIDPATGREVFIKKDGTQTFVYDYNDEVNIGDTEPKMEGVIGTSLRYKKFSMNLNLRYRVGGQIFQQTLFTKVENINIDGIHYNQDARALTKRWKNAGDLAKFKSIAITNTNLISSRFVADEFTLAGESITFGYDAEPVWAKRLGLRAITARMYMSEIFRLSNIVNERGLDYPFSRSISMSLGLTF